MPNSLEEGGWYIFMTMPDCYMEPDCCQRWSTCGCEVAPAMGDVRGTAPVVVAKEKEKVGAEAVPPSLSSICCVPKWSVCRHWACVRAAQGAGQ